MSIYRSYPRPEKLWHWEEIALILFCLTLPMQNAGIIKAGFTFAKIFLMVGYPYYLVRAFLRRDMWFVLLPFKSWVSVAIWGLFFVNLASGVHALHEDMWVGFNARYLQLYNAITFLVYVIKREKRILYAFIAGLLIGSIPNCLAGTYELVTKKMALKYAFQGTEDQRQAGGARTVLTGGEGNERIIGFDGGAGEHALHFVVYGALFAVLPFIFKNRFLQISSLVLLFLSIVNVAGTGSRTGMIGLALAIVVFFIFIEMRRKWLIILVLLASTVLAIIVFDLPIGRLLGLQAYSRETISFRVEQYRTAYNMFMRHKFIGIGAGQYVGEYFRYQWNYPAHERKWSVLPLHNSILNQLAEGGLLGLFFMLALLFTVCYECYVVRIRSPNRTHRMLAVGILSGFAGWGAGLLFYPSFLDEQGWILMAFVMALTNVHALEKRPAAAAPRNAARTPVQVTA